jgi:hypothetical protein
MIPERRLKKNFDGSSASWSITGLIAGEKIDPNEKKWERLKESGSYGSINELHFINHIKRPIVTLDVSLFGQFDKEIFGTQ